MPVRSLKEYHILVYNGVRYFTRGLPNFKRYYGELGHYPAYYIHFYI